jgi:hypothetical protein
MTRDELKQHIALYKKTENDVFELENKFGIRIWDSKEPNFYNNYNLIIHRLLADIFGETKSELIEDYIFEQVDISFDELCEYLNI